MEYPGTFGGSEKASVDLRNPDIQITDVNVAVVEYPQIGQGGVPNSFNNTSGVVDVLSVTMSHPFEGDVTWFIEDYNATGPGLQGDVLDDGDSSATPNAVGAGVIDINSQDLTFISDGVAEDGSMDVEVHLEQIFDGIPYVRNFTKNIPNPVSVPPPPTGAPPAGEPTGATQSQKQEAQEQYNQAQQRANDSKRFSIKVQINKRIAEQTAVDALNELRRRQDEAKRLYKAFQNLPVHGTPKQQSEKQEALAAYEAAEAAAAAAIEAEERAAREYENRRQEADNARAALNEAESQARDAYNRWIDEQNEEEVDSAETATDEADNAVQKFNVIDVNAATPEELAAAQKEIDDKAEQAQAVINRARESGAQRRWDGITDGLPNLSDEQIEQRLQAAESVLERIETGRLPDPTGIKKYWFEGDARIYEEELKQREDEREGDCCTPIATWSWDPEGGILGDGSGWVDETPLFVTKDEIGRNDNWKKVVVKHEGKCYRIKDSRPAAGAVINYIDKPPTGDWSRRGNPWEECKCCPEMGPMEEDPGSTGDGVMEFPGGLMTTPTPTTTEPPDDPVDDVTTPPPIDGIDGIVSVDPPSTDCCGPYVEWFYDPEGLPGQQSWVDNLDSKLGIFDLGDLVEQAIADGNPRTPDGQRLPALKPEEWGSWSKIVVKYKGLCYTIKSPRFARRLGRDPYKSTSPEGIGLRTEADNPWQLCNGHGKCCEPQGTGPSDSKDGTDDSSSDGGPSRQFCESPKVWDEQSGRCVCPEGFEEDEEGNCVPVPVDPATEDTPSEASDSGGSSGETIEWDSGLIITGGGGGTFQDFTYTYDTTPPPTTTSTTPYYTTTTTTSTTTSTTPYYTTPPPPCTQTTKRPPTYSTRRQLGTERPGTPAPVTRPPVIATQPPPTTSIPIFPAPILPLQVPFLMTEVMGATTTLSVTTTTPAPVIRTIPPTTTLCPEDEDCNNLQF